MSDHEEIESSVAAWVLGALDAEEADSVRSHAEGCPTCREVAGRLRRVVGALPLVVDEVSPPTRLRQRVLAAAGSTRCGSSRGKETPSRPRSSCRTAMAPGWCWSTNPSRATR